jgi:hypothetical protein
MKPYEPGYIIAKCLAPSSRMARSQIKLFSRLSHRPATGQTINFTELATAFSGKAQTDSHDKRLQRFFRHFEMDYGEIAQTVVSLMAIPEPFTRKKEVIVRLPGAKIAPTNRTSADFHTRLENNGAKTKNKAATFGGRFDFMAMKGCTALKR